MTVSVFIRVRDEAASLAQTLAAIASGLRKPDEVVVLDNDSLDDTERVARLAGARVATISHESFTYGRALNRAITETSGSIVVFVSAHSPPVDEHWLQRLVEPIELGEADATFGRQVAVPGVNRLEEWVLWRTFPRRSSRFLATLGVQKVTFSNANAAISRRLLQAHPFNEELAFAEDIEWWRRAASESARILYCPEAVVFHSHAFEGDQLERRMFDVGLAMRQQGRGAIYRNVFTYASVFLATVFIDVLFCLIRGYISTLQRILPYRASYFRGLRRGASDNCKAA